MEQTGAVDLLCSEGTWAPTASWGSFSTCEIPEPHKQCLSQPAAARTPEFGSSMPTACQERP